MASKVNEIKDSNIHISENKLDKTQVIGVAISAIGFVAQIIVIMTVLGVIKTGFTVIIVSSIPYNVLITCYIAVPGMMFVIGLGIISLQRSSNKNINYQKQYAFLLEEKEKIEKEMSTLKKQLEDAKAQYDSLVKGLSDREELTVEREQVALGKALIERLERTIAVRQMEIDRLNTILNLHAQRKRR